MVPPPPLPPLPPANGSSPARGHNAAVGSPFSFTRTLYPPTPLIFFCGCPAPFMVIGLQEVAVPGLLISGVPYPLVGEGGFVSH